MTSLKKLWTYKPLSDRRRDGDRSGRSAEPEEVTSPIATPSNIQRSASLIYHPDLLSSQIKDFLQRTDRCSRERWRSKSRSIDEIAVARIDDARSSRSRSISRSSCLSPPKSYCSQSSLSSRENSILEEDVQEPQLESNGDMPECDSITKRRYESLKKQFQLTKQKLEHEHNTEMDNILSLKKQLEKKLYDAYESLDEQKQIVCQWKKKFGKLTLDFSDMKLQLEDQYSQNALLDKRRRKEEADFQYLTEQLNQEKLRCDKLFREKEIIIQENGNLQQTTTDLSMELQTKSMEIKSLKEELENAKSSFSVTTVDMDNLKKTNKQLKNKCLELEEELENKLRQIDEMEESKYKVEQSIERIKKEHKQEIAQREDQTEQLRYTFEKKIKALQCELEQENHEKTQILKEKFKLDRQIEDLQESVSQSQSSAVSLLDKMKNKLIKTKALLKDERNKDQTFDNNKVLLRKLKNQLDGVELEKLTAIKSKQKYEMEYTDLVSSMAQVEKSKSEVERKLQDYIKEVNNQQRIIEDKEEEIIEIMNKFGSATQQLADNQAVIQDLTDKLSSIENDKSSLSVHVVSLQTKLENQQTLASSSYQLQSENYKAKIKELESKNELDKATISRREQQLSQLSMQLEKALAENDKAQTMVTNTARELKSYTRQISDLTQENTKLAQRESDLLMRNKDLALKIQAEETEKNLLLAQLKVTNDRLEKLKQVIEDSTSCSYFSDSSTESVDDTTISMVSLDDYKFRSETPDSCRSYSSDTESRINHSSLIRDKKSSQARD